MGCDILNQSNRPVGYYENTREEMLRYVSDGARKTLEFGCGTGGFSAMLKDRLGTESWGVEINSTAANKASKKLDKVIASDAMLALAEIPDDYFDCVIFFDVLEHLVDPYALLETIKGKLSEKGVIIASIPNIRYYRILSDLVLRGNWDYKDHGVLDKTHLRFFTKKSIIKVFDRLGYDILKIEGMHPTSSRTFSILNTIMLNRTSDVRYKHFAVVVRPK